MRIMIILLLFLLLYMPIFGDTKILHPTMVEATSFLMEGPGFYFDQYRLIDGDPKTAYARLTYDSAGETIMFQFIEFNDYSSKLFSLYAQVWAIGPRDMDSFTDILEQRIVFNRYQKR